MGINRVSVQCKICNDGFALRVTVGGNEQSHMFNCPSCDSYLGYRFKINDLMKSDVSEFYENCVKSSKFEQTQIINLHPDFPIPKKELYNSRFSTNIYMIDLALKNVNDPEMVDGIVDGDAVAGFWKEIKINWDLYDNQKFDILNNRIDPFDKKRDSKFKFLGQLYDFASFAHLDKCETPWDARYKNLVAKLIDDHKTEFIRFLEFHNENIFHRNLDFYKVAMTDLFNGFNDIKQVRLMAKLNISTEDHVISSVDFDSTKKVYGNLFETIDKTFCVPALLERILTHGNFDNFDKISIQDYLSSSITSKMQNKSATNLFTAPSPRITNNRIRNASHHSTIFFDKKTQIVSCNDKDKKLDVNYLEYLTNCTHVSNYILGLMSIDLELHSYLRSNNV